MSEIMDKVIGIIKAGELSVNCTITGELLEMSKVSDVKSMVADKLITDIAVALHHKFADSTISEFEHPYLEGAITFKQQVFVLTMDNILDIKGILGA